MERSSGEKKQDVGHAEAVPRLTFNNFSEAVQEALFEEKEIQRIKKKRAKDPNTKERRIAFAAVSDRLSTQVLEEADIEILQSFSKYQPEIFSKEEQQLLIHEGIAGRETFLRIGNLTNRLKREVGIANVGGVSIEKINEEFLTDEQIRMLKDVAQRFDSQGIGNFDEKDREVLLDWGFLEGEREVEEAGETLESVPEIEVPIVEEDVEVKKTKEEPQIEPEPLPEEVLKWFYDVLEWAQTPDDLYEGIQQVENITCDNGSVIKTEEMIMRLEQYRNGAIGAETVNHQMLADRMDVLLSSEQQEGTETRESVDGMQTLDDRLEQSAALLETERAIYESAQREHIKKKKAESFLERVRIKLGGAPKESEENLPIFLREARRRYDTAIVEHAQNVTEQTFLKLKQQFAGKIRFGDLTEALQNVLRGESGEIEYGEDYTLTTSDVEKLKKRNPEVEPLSDEIEAEYRNGDYNQGFEKRADVAAFLDVFITERNRIADLEIEEMLPPVKGVGKKAVRLLKAIILSFSK